MGIYYGGGHTASDGTYYNLDTSAHGDTAACHAEPPECGCPEIDTDDTLGPCGCVDYHYSDCPTRDTAAEDMDSMERYYREMGWME